MQIEGLLALARNMDSLFMVTKDPPLFFFSSLRPTCHQEGMCCLGHSCSLKSGIHGILFSRVNSQVIPVHLSQGFIGLLLFPKPSSYILPK